MVEPPGDMEIYLIFIVQRVDIIMAKCKMN